MKDVLLIRAGDFHLAFPAERMLEIIDVVLYHKQQEADLKQTLNEKKPKKTETIVDVFTDQFRLWRQHVLPVMHLHHYLNNEAPITQCRFSVVYQANESDLLFIDVDHIFGIIHMDTSLMQPIYHPYKELAKLSRQVCKVPGENIFAFVLEEECDFIKDKRWVMNVDHYTQSQ